MRNFTFRRPSFFRFTFFLSAFLFLITNNVSAQFYSKHYIAPAPWQYFSKSNEIVIATNSITTVNITVSKSDGTLVTNLTAIKGTPAVYRFPLLAKNLPMHPLNSVVSGAGLIVTSTGGLTSINLRNVASDDGSGDNNDANLKGNAALTSFGDAGIGVRFRVGYYRNGSLGNFGNFGEQFPIYTIMATVDNTTVKIDNVITATLNAGQSYLFHAPMGTLVESSNPTVMNTSAGIDTPGGCGDSAFNQIPPEAVLGTEYFLERGTGNDIAEQTTVIATKDNTKITVTGYSTTGALVSTNNVTLALAGDFHTFINGSPGVSFTASRVVADKRVVVYSGTAQSCEVDVSTIAPVSECGGSNFIETAKFRDYGTGTLKYFGYILLKSDSDVVTVNGNNIETISGITARHQIGTTGWYLINFNDTQIGQPNFLSIASTAKLTVSIVQQDGGFSMAGFFSNFAEQPEDPTLTYISGGGCTNNTAELTTPAGFAPYQWYFNGVAIDGANSSAYTATKTGAYSVASTLICGAQTPSKPITVTLCTDLGITKKVDNTAPCVGSNVEFTLKVSNLGGNNVSGVSVTDLLPSGYDYVSSVPSIGSYNSATGVWSIGDLGGETDITLKITAKVNASGNYTNTASLPASIDTNSANNSASAAVNPKALPNLIITNPAAVCSPSTVDLTAPGVTAGSSSNLTFTYWTNASATTPYTTPSTAAAGTYYIKTVSAEGCEVIKSVTATVNSPSNTPTISSSATINSGSISCFTGSSLTLTSSGNSGTFLWSTGETTKTITVTANGTYTVKRINSSGCVSNSSSAVIVSFRPAVPTASTQTFCAAENKKISDLVATGSNLKWYTAASGGSALASTQNLPTTAGSYTYYATQTVNSCESSRSAAVTININTLSSAPVASAQTFCAAENKKVNDLIASGTSKKWYNASTGGTLYNGNETLVTGNYYVSQTANTCGESARTLLTVTLNSVPAAPTASPQTFCAIDGKKVNDLVATGTGLKWYNASTGGTLYNGNETLVTGNYYVSQTTNSCGESPRRLVAVTINSTTAPTASSQTFCANDAKKVSDLVPSGTGFKWYNSSTGGTVYAGTEILTTGNYYVSQTLSGCESTRTLVSVTVNNVPVPTAFGQSFCAAENKKVDDLTASGSSLKWYSTSTGGTAYSGTEILSSGNYFVSQTTSCGESARALVSVTINPTPAAPSIIASGPTSFCFGGSVTLTSSGGNSYLWSTGATTPSITVSASGNYSVQVDNASGCISPASAATTVTVNSIPSAPTASAQTFCILDAKNVNDLTPSGASIKWYNASTAGALYAGTELLATGTYYVSQTINGCESARTSVLVTVNSKPADVVTTATICSGASYTWTANSTAYTTSQSGLRIVNNGCTADQVLNLTVTPKPADVITTATICSGATYTWTANSTAYTTSQNGLRIVNDGCTADQVLNLTVTPKPADVVTTATICSGATYTWTANSTDYTIAGTYTLNNDGCTANQVLVLNVNTVTKPIINTINQLTCGLSTASVELSGLPTGTWTINPGNISGNTTTAVISGLLPGNTYNFTVTNSLGCESLASADVIISDFICAEDDNPSSINGGTGGTIPTVFVNDKINGAAFLQTDVSLTTSTLPSGLTFNLDGTITIAPNTPAGTHLITYTICKSTNLGVCDSATVEVVITAPIIDAITENTLPVNGSTGGTTTTSLTANDTLNGTAVVIGTSAGQVKLTPVNVPSGLHLNADGTVKVDPLTPIGTYEVEYSICEVNNPANCDIVKSYVPVIGAVLVLKDDTASPTASTSQPTTVLNVYSNDTKNGLSIVPSEVTLTETIADPTGSVTLDTDGNIILKANTPAGTYTLTYQVCELNTTNCATAQVTIKVTAPLIDAAAETTDSLNGSTGGTTTTSLIAHDTLNGIQAVIGTAHGEVKLSGINLPSGFTLNPNGTVTVAAGTPAGNYEIEYSICEITNPSNCDTAKSTVPVTIPVTPPAVLVLKDDIAASVIGSNQPINVLNVLDNDTKNGLPIIASEVTISIVTPDPTGLMTVSPNGTITLPANTPAGTYELVYQVCELNTTNCSTASVKVTVVAPVITVIKANDDAAGPIDISKGTNTALNIFDNDTLNGVKLTASNVVLTTVSSDPNLILNADGSIDLIPKTPSGTYQLTYQICDASNTSNCSQAVVKVIVLNNIDAGPPKPPTLIILKNDATVAVDGVNGSLEFINVLDNDLLDGLPIDPVKINITNSPANSNFEFNSDGTVNVKPNTPGGNYTLTYQVCEKANATNCSTATLTVFVEVPAIAIVKTAVFNDENNSGVANAGETITYKFKVTNTGNVALTGIMVTDPLPGVIVSGQAIDLQPGESDETNFTAQYTITQSDINLGSVSNQASVQGKSARGVVVDDLSDSDGNSGDKPTVIKLNGCELKVFSGFSPNGDSKNARFYIQGIECYPENTVEIYNRWGVLVFDIEHYNNADRSFTGISQGRVTVKQADGLPAGTYFYILKYKDSASIPHELSGYLYINK